MSKTKELRISSRISTHDLGTKVKQAKKFLDKKFNVRFVMRRKGRENLHLETALAVFSSINDALLEVAKVIEQPKVKGNKPIQMMCWHK